MERLGGFDSVLYDYNARRYSGLLRSAIGQSAAVLKSTTKFVLTYIAKPGFIYNSARYLNAWNLLINTTEVQFADFAGIDLNTRR